MGEIREISNDRDLFRLWVDWVIRRENLTKSELAKNLGISYNHFSNISSCNRQPGKNAVNKLISYLNISNTDYYRGIPVDPPSHKVTCDENGVWTDHFILEIENELKDTHATDKTKLVIWKLLDTLSIEDIETVYDFVKTIVRRNMRKKLNENT